MKCLVNIRKQSPKSINQLANKSLSPKNFLKNEDRVLIRTHNNFKDKLRNNQLDFGAVIGREEPNSM